MSEEDAINYIKMALNTNKTASPSAFIGIPINELKAVLNLIEKQNKVIDKMAEELCVSKDYKEEEKENIKSYFYKEIENE